MHTLHNKIAPWPIRNPGRVGQGRPHSLLSHVHSLCHYSGTTPSVYVVPAIPQQILNQFSRLTTQPMRTRYTGRVTRQVSLSEGFPDLARRRFSGINRMWLSDGVL